MDAWKSPARKQPLAPAIVPYLKCDGAPTTNMPDCASSTWSDVSFTTTVYSMHVCSSLSWWTPKPVDLKVEGPWRKACASKSSTLVLKCFSSHVAICCSMAWKPGRCKRTFGSSLLVTSRVCKRCSSSSCVVSVLGYVLKPLIEYKLPMLSRKLRQPSSQSEVKAAAQFCASLSLTVRAMTPLASAEVRSGSSLLLKATCFSTSVETVVEPATDAETAAAERAAEPAVSETAATEPAPSPSLGIISKSSSSESGCMRDLWSANSSEHSLGISITSTVGVALMSPRLLRLLLLPFACPSSSELCLGIILGVVWKPTRSLGSRMA